MKTKIRPIVIGTLSVFAVVACLALVVPTQSADAENTASAVATSLEITTEETTTVTSTTETETTTVTESTEETTVAQTEATVAETYARATYSAPQTEAYVAPAAQTEAYVAPAPQTYYNQVEFLGYYFNVGPVLANNIYDKAGMRALVNYIDSGGIGAMGAPLNVYDGTGTYIAGHNPGVMGLFASNLNYGSVVTVHDINGNARQYVANAVVTTPINNTGSSPNTSTPNASAISMMNSLAGRESLVIQFCIGSTMYLWRLDAI